MALDRFRIGAVILMAGEGLRFGGSVPKQFQLLAGKKIFRHTLDVFLEAGWVDEIALVCHPDWLSLVEKEVEGLARVVIGGNSRQESSYLGLKSFQKAPDVALIHDAVRPFIDVDLLERNVRGAIDWGAIDTCIPSSDTLVYAPGGKRVAKIPLRSDFLRGQTPQTFQFNLILEAHEKALKDGFLNASDDCQLMLRLGKDVGIVLGDEHNRKITTELDLFLAEQILRLRKAPCPKQTNAVEKKHFAVLGGFGGIGSALGKLLEKEGATVTRLSRKTGLDLTKPSTIAKALKLLGPIDGLINCAGELKVKPLEMHTLQEIQELVQINFTGLVMACRQAQIRPGGHIVNLASSSYTKGRKNYGIYSAAKAAVINFTQSLAEERPHLHIHAVIPQRTHTAMRTKNFPGEDPSSLLDAEDVAEAILQLLKDSSHTALLVDVKKTLP